MDNCVNKVGSYMEFDDHYWWCSLHSLIVYGWITVQSFDFLSDFADLKVELEAIDMMPDNDDLYFKK
jgi:hypothetical protein